MKKINENPNIPASLTVSSTTTPQICNTEQEPYINNIQLNLIGTIPIN